jgi:hypothetical protein
MEKLILLGFVLMLVGCGSAPIKVNTEVKETLVPVLYSPAPPVIKRPELPIHQMTGEQLKEDGEVVKYYKATIKVLIGYSEELRKALGEYDKINKAYDEERKKLEAKIAEKNAAKKPK